MISTIRNRDKWVFNSCHDIFDDKLSLIENEYIETLSKTLKMFRYNNLPDTISTRDIELNNQVNGFSTWGVNTDGKLYVFYTGLGGEPNEYYLPTKAVVSNPYLRLNKTWDIDNDCVVMRNDYFYRGLTPTINKYCTLLADAYLSLRQALYIARIPFLVSADNQRSKDSAEEFFKKIENGVYGVIGGADFFDGIKSHEFGKTTSIMEIIESIQYIKGSLYSELGISAPYNMKREALNSTEVAMNEDVLFPMVEMMFECRKQDVEKINKMFGLKISVELDSIWNDNMEEKNIEIINLEANNDSGGNT